MVRIAVSVVIAALALVRPCTAQLDENHHKLADMPSGLYRSDNGHTDIYFMYSHVGFTQAHARFDRFSGSFDYNPQFPERSPVTFTIDPASVDSNVSELDRILKGKHFFNVDRYPEIKFVGHDLKRTSSTTGVLDGDLTMHGITRRVALDVRLNKFLVDKELKFCRFGFSVKGTLQRSAWGLGDIPLVGDDISLDLEVEFLKAVGPRQAPP